MKQENLQGGLVLRKYDLTGLHPDVRRTMKIAAIRSAEKESGGNFLSVTDHGSVFEIVGKNLATRSEGDQM